MTKVVFLRSQHPSTDSRLNKYLNALHEVNADYLVFGWNREGYKDHLNPKWKLYEKKTPLGGGMKNIWALVLWNWYVLRNLIQSRKEYTIIHAVDFDTILPSWLVGKLFRKKIIYDIYDKYTESRGISGKVSLLIDKLERFFSKKSDILIVADQCRYEQLGVDPVELKKTYVVENIPRIKFERVEFPEIVNGIIRLCYVGILEENHRGLEDLLEIVSQNPNLRLDIAGDGPLRKKISNYQNQYHNVFYHGPVAYKVALELMSEAHIVVGLYYLTNNNHRYAAPNKYWEHLFLGRALLTTLGTSPGAKVLDNGSGIVVQDNKEALLQELNKLNHSLLKGMGEKAGLVWDEHKKDVEELHIIYKQCQE